MQRFVELVVLAVSVCVCTCLFIGSLHILDHFWHISHMLQNACGSCKTGWVSFVWFIICTMLVGFRWTGDECIRIDNWVFLYFVQTYISKYSGPHILSLPTLNLVQLDWTSLHFLCSIYSLRMRIFGCYDAELKNTNGMSTKFRVKKSVRLRQLKSEGKFCLSNLFLFSYFVLLTNKSTKYLECIGKKNKGKGSSSSGSTASGDAMIE